MSSNCEIGWAEVHHDVALAGENGTVLARKSIDTGTAGGRADWRSSPRAEALGGSV